MSKSNVHTIASLNNNGNGTQTIQLKHTKQNSVIDEDDDPTTEQLYMDVIDEARIKLKSKDKQLLESMGKCEILQKILNEEHTKNKSLNTKIEIYEKKLYNYENKKDLNKKAINEKISKMFDYRDKKDEDDVKKSLEEYEKSLRAQYL